MTGQDDDEEVKTKKAYINKRTPAQIAFDKMQEKRVSENPEYLWAAVTGFGT